MDEHHHTYDDRILERVAGHAIGAMSETIPLQAGPEFLASYYRGQLVAIIHELWPVLHPGIPYPDHLPPADQWPYGEPQDAAINSPLNPDKRERYNAFQDELAARRAELG